MKILFHISTPFSSGLPHLGRGPFFLAIATVFLAIGSLTAQTVLIDNNFNSVTAGTYSGTAGVSFGASSTLGNATGSFIQNVQNTLGVSGTNGLQGTSGSAPRDTFARSRATSDSSLTTSFSMYFYTNYGGASTFTNNMFVGAGFALAAGTDAVGAYNTGGNERLLVGIRQTANNFYGNLTFGACGQTSGGVVLSGTPTFSLARYNWYQLSFNLTFDGISTFTVANVALLDWGADGVTGGSSVATLSNSTVSTALNRGQNFGSSAVNAYAYYATNFDRGGGNLDNLYAAVPEPATWALLAFSLTTVMVMRRRHRK